MVQVSDANLDRVFAFLVAAAERGEPCPSNFDIDRELFRGHRTAYIATVSLADEGRIVLEYADPELKKGGLRRIMIADTGAKTGWSENRTRYARPLVDDPDAWPLWLSYVDQDIEEGKILGKPDDARRS